MIRVVSPKIETPIFLCPEKISLLIVENPAEFYRTVQEFIFAFDGELSDFTFWDEDEDKKLSPSKCGELLLQLFSFDFSDKKIISLLYKKLVAEGAESERLLQLNAINAQVSAYVQDLAFSVDYALDFEDLTTEDILKGCAVKPAKYYRNLTEKIICYINLMSELKPTRFFVFVGLKDVLNDEELQKVYRHCLLQQVSLLLIESGKKRDFLSEEQAVMITEDLCEIVANIEEK